MLAKLVTYNSQRYVGILGSGLLILQLYALLMPAIEATCYISRVTICRPFHCMFHLSKTKQQLFPIRVALTDQ